MLLKNPISSTKRLFSKTLQSVKSFFSPGYERLPKHREPLIDPVYFDMNFQAKCEELDSTYTGFSSRWDSGYIDSVKKSNNERKTVAPPQPNTPKETGDGNRGKQGNGINAGRDKAVDERRGQRLMAEKLRELEMLDLGNVDHVMDIEEVLHYYSRLTCPAYLDMVDRFLMELYSEFAGLPASSNRANRSFSETLNVRRRF